MIRRAFMRGVWQEETKTKFRETRRKRLVAKYDWSFVDPYLDVDMSLSSRNKKTKLLTFREFKRLILEGKTLSDIIAMGYSKHVVYFMSKFSQGKITLTKQAFELDYYGGASLEEIAKKHGITREDATFLRQCFQVKAKGPTFINRKKTEIPLTEEQKQIIIGSMLGDATKMGQSAVKMKHGKEQKEYLYWKYRKLSNLVSDKAHHSSPYEDKRGYKGLVYRFFTKANTDIEDIVSMFHDDGKKVVTSDVLDSLTPLSLAVWYMDDGCTGFNHRQRVKYPNTKPTLSLCTDCFTKDECEAICDCLKAKFGISAYIKRRKDSMFRVVVHAESSERFLGIIRPYIEKVQCMHYKIDAEKSLAKLRQKRAIKDPIPLDVNFHGIDRMDQEEIVRRIVSFYYTVGFDWLLPKPGENKSDLKSLVEFDASSINGKNIPFRRIGWKYCLSHFPNFWKGRSKANKSPYEIFSNRRYLTEIVRKLLILEKGATPKNVLRELRRYRGNKAISAFMPSMAKMIYEKYAPNGARVLDFCGGYGGRMLGAATCDKVSEFWAIEPNFDSFTNLLTLKGSIRNLGKIKKPIEVRNGASPEYLKRFKDSEFDFCFTSIPYFDAEEYSDEESQSWVQHSDSYADWFEKFLIPTLSEATRVSKVLAVNSANTIGYRISDDIRDAIPSIGKLKSEGKLEYPNYGSKRYEELFVIRR